MVEKTLERICWYLILWVKDKSSQRNAKKSKGGIGKDLRTQKIKQINISIHKTAKTTKREEGETTQKTT